MAKQRRGRAASPPRRASRRSPSGSGSASRGPRPQPVQPPPPPPRKPSYLEAVSLYERGLEALQRRDFSTAAERLREVLTRYPEERDLLERVRLYLRVCEREAGPREASPKTSEERIYAATLALNAGATGDAMGHLRRVTEEDPDNDHAQYMLSAVHAQRGDTETALAHLARAIELNAENRALARRDPDLEALRGEDGFRALTEATAPPSPRRRSRGRSSR
jgi:tetratricopeptide (TPR) repeat protein